MKHVIYPFELKVSNLKRAGIGIFTRQNFKKGISFYDLMDNDAILVKDCQDKQFRDHFGVKVKGGWWLPSDPMRISMWWYINHSDHPNVDCADDKWTALRDIKKGEELTCDYNQLDPTGDNWSHFRINQLTERIEEMYSVDDTIRAALPGKGRGRRNPK